MLPVYATSKSRLIDRRSGRVDWACSYAVQAVANIKNKDLAAMLTMLVALVAELLNYLTTHESMLAKLPPQMIPAIVVFAAFARWQWPHLFAAVAAPTDEPKPEANGDAVPEVVEDEPTNPEG